MKDYQYLANAIVLQAVTDYRNALMALNINNRNRVALNFKKECEIFFHSDWYRTLTSVDGEMLIKKLKAEAV